MACYYFRLLEGLRLFQGIFFNYIFSVMTAFYFNKNKESHPTPAPLNI